ncbi:hypothetical protein ACFVYR_13955 [Streptomyces sp. NPDC058284]|uniref:hypothetical protein n=1 Tax=unclassified Streptomyces TaxID=2593676 RepID=UPI00364EDC6F
MTHRTAVAALTTVLCLLSASPAAAGGFGDTGEQKSDTSGDSTGPLLMSKVVFKVEGGQASADGSGSLTPTALDWKIPACWYEPYWKAKDFKTFMEAQWSIHKSAGGNPNKIAGAKERYKGGHPYKNFNADKNGKGMWWVAVKNKDMKNDPAARACTRPPFWVDKGKPANVPQAINPKTLAALAYQQTKVPDTKVELKPEATSTVNLPTWVWLDKGTFKEIRVRAELPDTGLWAETTAKPVSLHLNSGTEDAETYPATGECTFNKDGSIGTPYKKGNAEQDPPCGIKYRRATGDHPYQLKASVTWSIEWHGSGKTKGDLPDGTFETTQDMNVQEIQSINR